MSPGGGGNLFTFPRAIARRKFFLYFAPFSRWLHTYTPTYPPTHHVPTTHTGHLSSTDRPSACHPPTMYLPPTCHLLATYIACTYHIQTICLPYTYHILTIYLPPTFHRQTIYLPHTYHLEPIYMPSTYHVPAT